jgi:hypothetical protein
MQFLPVPKYLNWPQNQSIHQHWTCDFDILITSGCSFTSSTTWLKGAASWPGYVRDRCGIRSCIDMSFPGSGNQYIADSIKYAIENFWQQDQYKKLLVIVMWSGIDRFEVISDLTTSQPTERCPVLGNKIYTRILRPSCQIDTVKMSKDYILDLKTYLDARQIDWIFTSYANLLFPPFIPKRDTTGHFQDFLTTQEIKQLQSIPWIPSAGMDFLYEWSWKNDFLNTGDYFHPPNEANFAWTDQILLPQMANRNLIKSIIDSERI